MCALEGPVLLSEAAETVKKQVLQQLGKAGASLMVVVVGQKWDGGNPGMGARLRPGPPKCPVAA